MKGEGGNSSGWIRNSESKDKGQKSKMIRSRSLKDMVEVKGFIK